MHNPHYDEQGSVAPPHPPFHSPSGTGHGTTHTFCRKCLKDIAVDTNGEGRLVAVNPDGTPHPCTEPPLVVNEA